MCYPCYRAISERLRTIVREHTPKDDKNQGFIDNSEAGACRARPICSAAGCSTTASREGRYYTQREAAAAADVDPKTLYVWLRNGDVAPSIKVTDKKFLWTDADIEELKQLKRKNASLHNSRAARARWEKAQKQSGDEAKASLIAVEK